MPNVKLTETTWLNSNVERVKGRLIVVLESSANHAGRPIGDLVAMLAEAGLTYTAVELAAIRDKLIADGVIQIV
jgi:hypothetical protein